MIKSFRNFISDVKSIFLDFVRQKDFGKKFAFVYGTYFIGILSLLQANYLYKTDLSRVADVSYDSANWSHSGRLLNDLLILIFHFDFYPQDISPLSQLLAIAVLSLASMTLVYTICKKTTYLRLFFSVILGLNPYYLQILSYVFDCLFYSIGMLAAVLPFLFWKKRNVFYAASAVCTLCCYLIFQSTVSVYMVLTAYFLFIDYQNEKISIKSQIKNIGVIITSFLSITLLYYVVVRLSFSAYMPAIEQSNLCTLPDCLNVFSQNLHHCLVNIFYTHWKATPMGFAFVCVIILFLVYMLHQAFLNKRKYPRAIHILISLSTIFFMLFFVILWTMFFTFIYWNSRIFTAFGCCFAVMMLASSNEKLSWLRKIFMTASFVLMWGCFVFAARVGNLLEIQKRYESFVFFTLAQDLTKFPHKEVMFDFKTIRSPIVRNKAKQYPIISDLVTALQPRYMRFNLYFTRFYRPDIKICQDKTIKMRMVVLENAHHKFTQINDTCLAISFKRHNK